jgi:hypothetical protein
MNEQEDLTMIRAVSPLVAVVFPAAGSLAVAGQ